MASLVVRVRSGFVWSVLSSSALRLSALVTGIYLAHVLAPEEFGVFAIAATVQTVVMTVAELGLAADLVRHGRFAERGPTIATISVVSSAALTAGVWFAAPALASAMGSADATPVIRVMSLTLLLAGAAVVPYAKLQRELRQRALFGIEAVAFVISTGLTIGLAVAGWGPMAIAVGRLVSMVAVVVLEFAVTKTRPRLGWNRSVASSGLRFSVPLAAAGLLSLTVLSIDNVLVGRLMGVGALGLYTLAFNVASWPSSVIGMAVRAVAMPAFSQRSEGLGKPDDRALVRATELTWAITAPVSTALGILAVPLVAILYGPRWEQAAPALALLAVLGAIRIVTDVWVAFLTASGRSSLLLGCQALWLAALVPAMWWGINSHGLVGAGLAHITVAVVVVVPLYLLALRRSGVPSRAVIRPMLVPLAAAVPAAIAGIVVVNVAPNHWVQLFGGGAAIGIVYTAIAGRWITARIPVGLIPGQRHSRAERSAQSVLSQGA